MWDLIVAPDASMSQIGGTVQVDPRSPGEVGTADPSNRAPVKVAYDAQLTHSAGAT